MAGEGPPVAGEGPPVAGERPPVAGEGPPVAGEGPPQYIPPSRYVWINQKLGNDARDV